MYKIIKIENPEILEETNPSIWGCVSLIVEYENGGQQRILKSIPEFKLEKYKKMLIGLGYDEIYLNELLELQIESCTRENIIDTMKEI